jgi:hypothetical protein
MFSKKTKELEKKLEYLKNRLGAAEEEVFDLSVSNNKYKKTFSQLFTRLSLTNVTKYEVKKDLTDDKVFFNIKYDDGTNYTYKIELVEVGYVEVLGDNNGQTR